MEERRIFSIVLVEHDGYVTAQSSYSGAGDAVLELGLEIMGTLAGLDAAGEGVKVSPVLRSAWIH